MRFDVMCLFPEQITGILQESITGRAIKNNIFSLNVHNIRDYSKNKHKKVDDKPYSGGDGMLMTPAPIVDCYNAIVKQIGKKPYCIYMSPQGTVLTQKKAISLSKIENLTILCGHYEGVDQRAIDMIIDEEISIGDYVLTSGEIAGVVLIDCVSRMLDGVLKGSSCFENESHYNKLLEYPQYTRPQVFEGLIVPEVLINGNHKEIEKWKEEMSLKNTLKKRPDLLK